MRRRLPEPCRLGFHNSYMTRGLLGYDLACRWCDQVRYLDVHPPQWAPFDPRRGVDIIIWGEGVAACVWRPPNWMQERQQAL